MNGTFRAGAVAALDARMRRGYPQYFGCGVQDGKHLRLNDAVEDVPAVAAILDDARLTQEG